MRTPALEVRLHHVDRHAVRSVVVRQGYLTPGREAGRLNVVVGNLGLLGGELLRLVCGHRAAGAVDARDGSHDLGHVSCRGVDQVGHDRLGPCIRHGPGDHGIDVSGPDVVDVPVTLIPIGVSSAQ